MSGSAAVWVRLRRMMADGRNSAIDTFGGKQAGYLILSSIAVITGIVNGAVIYVVSGPDSFWQYTWIVISSVLVGAVSWLVIILYFIAKNDLDKNPEIRETNPIAIVELSRLAGNNDPNISGWLVKIGPVPFERWENPTIAILRAENESRDKMFSVDYSYIGGTGVQRHEAQSWPDIKHQIYKCPAEINHRMRISIGCIGGLPPSAFILTTTPTGIGREFRLNEAGTGYQLQPL